MNQIWTLTRMQLGSALEFLSIKHNKNRKKNVSVTTILLLGFLLFAFLSGTYSFMMGTALQYYGEIDVLPGLFMAATCLMIFFTSIYKVKGVLFGFKDYDIVMSLPVKTWKIVASRLMLLYLINMVFVLAFLVPNYIVYGIIAKPSPVFYVLSFISLFFVPLIPIIIASIVGVVLAVISAGFKHSNLIHTVLMFVAFLLLFALSFQMQSESAIAELGMMIRDQMLGIYPLSGWYLKGILEYDMISYLAFLAVSILATVVFSVIVGKYFKWMNTAISARRTSAKYKMTELKSKGQLKAMYQKEAKRYFSCGIYVFNTGFGLIMMIIGAFALMFFPPAQIEQMLSIPEAAGMLQDLFPYLMCFFVGTVAITASSISLEGKNLWILKSSPLSSKTILNAKLLFSLSLTVPVCAITSVIAGFSLGMEPLQIVLAVLIPVAYCFLTAVLGLVINLKLPLLDWKNETVVVKQSAASMVGTLSGMFTVAVPVVLLFVVKGIDTVLLGVGTLGVVVVVTLILQGYLNKNGAKLIAEL